MMIVVRIKRQRNMRRTLYLHVVVIEPDQGGLSLNCQMLSVVYALSSEWDRELVHP